MLIYLYVYNMPRSSVRHLEPPARLSTKFLRHLQNAIPDFHHLSPVCHQNTGPCQHHHPSSGSPYPMALKGLIGNGSNSQIADLAKSPTRSGAVQYIHINTQTIVVTFFTIFGVIALIPEFLHKLLPSPSSTTPTPCNKKKAAGLPGFV